MSSTMGSRERVAQKMRTRRALLAAAGQLIAEGRTPTVAEAADAALVSRATAYRYFPSQEALLAEAPLQLGLPTVASLFGAADAPTDVEDRVALVHNEIHDHIREREVDFRLFQRNSLLRSLETDRTEPNLRPAFRLQLLDAALEPLEPEVDVTSLLQLKTALCVLIGTEAIIAMRDVVGLDHDEARAHGEWAVRQQVRAVRQRSRADAEPSRHSQRPRR
jgi:AcrR family transcriptional regulator